MLIAQDKIFDMEIAFNTFKQLCPKNKAAEIDAATDICDRLQDSGFEAVFAGGFVRDMIRQRVGGDFNDIDIATNASPEQVRETFKSFKAFEVKEVGESFGVVLIRAPVLDHTTQAFRTVEFEVATFRKDIGSSDGRHPDSVEFSSMREDALRRDFTVNALFFDPMTKNLFDFVDGVADVKNRKLRFVGNAEDRIEEDHLRILRFFRLRQKGFLPSREEWFTVQKNFGLLDFVAKERIILELKKFFEKPMHPLFAHICLDELLLRIVSTEETASFSIDDFIRIAGSVNLTADERFTGSLALIEATESWMKEFKLSSAEIQEVVNIKVMLGEPFRLFTGFADIMIMEHFLLPFSDVDGFMLRVRKALHKKGFNQFRIILGEFAIFADIEISKPWPTPLLTGDDLIAKGLKPGPVFGEMLDKVFDAQLLEKVSTKEEAFKLLGID
jgi:tRNA nucleotidyltransferase/poly(A) polymerase